ncbi:Mlp family lipoprotein (plasmid) [Borrelia parkeri]|uniref:Mlp family lipoprotein n=1 Tax=Borrelia parkeri TaxID=141 RepID=UPI001FF115B8|nr:Mlp family lipoprotein [Borrelia parkeri]UPA11472.1 Mlp family lipoprotein [Borrelia parkeri]
MNKYIKLITFCSTVIFYCCDGNKLSSVSNTGFKTQFTNIKKPKIDNQTIKTVTLTDDEKEKFDILINGFDKALELDQYFKIDSNFGAKQSPNFLNWLRLIDISKKKELANLFTIVYDFLKDKKPPELNNLTINQFVINTIVCQNKNQCNNTYNKLAINTFFKDTLIAVCGRGKNNEDIFEYLKKELINPTNNVAGLMGEDRIIQARFSTTQIQALNFLKETLVTQEAHKLADIIRANKAKDLLHLSDITIKETLNHIYSEYSKCNKNAAGKTNFQDKLREYFDNNEVNETTMKQFINTIHSEQCRSAG